MKTNPNDIYESLGHMVEEGIGGLKNRMEQYISPTLKTPTGQPRKGIKAMAEDMGIDASNLFKIFDPEKDQQMSSWLFIKCCQHLKIWPEAWEYHPVKGMETQSVKIAFQTPRDPMMVCLVQLING